MLISVSTESRSSYYLKILSYVTVSYMYFKIIFRIQRSANNCLTNVHVSQFIKLVIFLRTPWCNVTIILKSYLKFLGISFTVNKHKILKPVFFTRINYKKPYIKHFTLNVFYYLHTYNQIQIYHLTYYCRDGVFDYLSPTEWYIFTTII